MVSCVVIALAFLKLAFSLDKKFAVKARLSGILLIVVGLLKKYPEDQEKLNIILKLLQALASSSKKIFSCFNRHH